MPLLQRRELLQRQRVDPARAWPARARRRAAASPAPRGRTAWARGLLALAPSPVNGTRLPGRTRRPASVGVDAELLEGALLSCSMRIRCSVRAISSRCTSCQLVVLASSARAARRAPAASSCSRLRRACSTAVPGLARGRREDSRRAARPRGRADGLGRAALAGAPLAALGPRARASRSAWAARGARRPGRAARGRAPRPVRSASRASISRCRGRAGSLDQLVARRGCRAPRRWAASARPAAPRARRGRPVLLAGGLGLVDGARSAGRPRRGRPRPASRTGRAPRRPPRGVASDSCSLARATSTPCWASCRSFSSREMSNREPLARRPGLGEPARGLVDRGLDLEQARLAREPPAARWAPSTSPSRVTAGRSGAARPAARGVEVVDHDDPGEQLGQRRAHGVGAVTRSTA